MGMNGIEIKRGYVNVALNRLVNMMSSNIFQWGALCTAVAISRSNLRGANL